MNKLITSTLICFLAIFSNVDSLNAQSAVFEWAKNMGGSSIDYGYGVTSDAAGNVYTVGSFQGTADFDPGVGTANLTANGPSPDIFISKLDAAGNFVWVKQVSGSSFEESKSINLDASGNIYVSGYFRGAVDFDPGVGNTTIFCTGQYDIFVLKLLPSGDLDWVKTMFGNLNTIRGEGHALELDALGNVYLTGTFNGVIDFNPGAGTANLTSNGDFDIFVLKLDASGNYVWAKNVGGTGEDYGNSIKVDNLGNVYTTGYFNGTVDFNPGAGTSSLSSAGSEDIFVLKLDASGNFVWAKNMGGTLEDIGLSLSLDASNNVYTTGYFKTTVDFDPGVGTSSLVSSGSADVFIQNLDASGNFIWAKRIGSNGDDRGQSIFIDTAKNVYTTGYFNGTVDFDPGIGATSHIASGSGSLFISKLDDIGDYVWSKSTLGSSSLEHGNSIFLDASNNIYVAGYLFGTADFNPDAGVTNLVSNGSYDATVMKFSQCFDMSITDVQVACDTYTWSNGLTYTSSNNTAVQNLTSIGGCDSTVTLNLTINHSTTGTDTQIACDSYTWIDGNTYTSSNTTATHILTNAVGCDSTVTLNLTIKNSSTGTDTQIACDSYTWIDGNTYTSSNNTATHILTNAVGCDSTVTLNLTINHSTTGTDTQIACDTYTWIDGNTYTSSNTTATHMLSTVAGCDSLVTLNLTINHATTGTDTQIACDTYTWIDGNSYTSSNTTATHILTNAVGCDSTVTLNLTINNATTGTDTQIACDSYTWIDGNTYTSSNTTATHILTNAVGCDSTVTLNLTINNATTGTDTQIACDSYTWIDGNTYTSSNNTATKMLTTVAGCDSLVTLDLTINHATTGTDTQIACDTYTWIDGNTYTSSNNTATKMLTTVAGCDSLVSLNLTINHSSTGTDTQIACDTYTWIDGNTYTSSNTTATHILTNAVGCDSTVTLNLTINHSTTGTDTQIACDTYTWIDGNAYTSSNNTATHILTNAVGCDSTVTLNLTINNATTGTDTQIACDTYTWIDGNTYTSSNTTATHMLSTVAGCDSLVTLNLTINHATTGTDTQIACDTYTWIDGNTYTSSNTTATHMLSTVAGCDSLVTLNLTIKNSSTGTDTQIACDTYTWIDGNTYTSSNTTATQILTNAVGCDSTVTLNLTINHSTTGTDTQIACDTYTWIDGNTYTSSNNTATHILTNAVGCDSTVTLNLTMNQSVSTVDAQVACNSFTWSNGVTYTTSNNSATQMLSTIAGCDSLVTLNLTVSSAYYATDVQTACHSYTWIDGNTYTSSNNTAVFSYVTGLGCDSVITLDLTITSIDDEVILSSFTIIARNNVATYQWINCDTKSAIIGATNQTFTASENGNYAVVVTENGCSDTSDCITIATMGLNEFTMNSLEIYPNPSKGQFVIETAAEISITISDVTGKLVSTQQLQIGKNTIDIQGVEPGMYLINCTDKMGRSVTKRINIMDI